MKKLLDKIKKLSVLILNHHDELEQLKDKHKEESKDLIAEIKFHENLIFPAAEKFYINYKFNCKCNEFIEKYGNLTDPIKEKLMDECLDISDISMKLEEEGVIIRRITEVIKIISYDDLKVKDKPILKVICK